MPSKTVVIRREESSLEGLPKAIAQDAKKVLSSVFRNGRPLEIKGKGIDTLLEPIVGLRQTENGFIDRREKFWRELTLKIPFGGRELEVGLNENGSPIDPKQWLIYQWVLNHPLVAKSEITDNGRIPAQEVMAANPMYRFCLIDNEEVKAQQKDESKIAKKAARLYFEDAEDIEKAKVLIRYLSPGTDVFSLDESDTKDILFELSRSLPLQYINASIDDSIGVRAELANLREAGIVTRAGNAYIYIDETIGNNEDQAVAWIKNPRNSRSLLTMRAKLDQYMEQKYNLRSNRDYDSLRQPSESLPEDPDPIIVQVPGDMPPGTSAEALAAMETAKAEASAKTKANTSANKA